MALDPSAAAPITSVDVARILGITPDRVRQLAREGHLAAIRTASGTRLYDRDSVERLRQARASR